MFNVSLFKELIKSKYTNSINLTFSKRVSNIVSKNNSIYNMDRIYELTDLPLLVIPTLTRTEDSRIFVDFATMLEIEHSKDFNWFRCLYVGGGIVFENVIICSNKTEEELYNKLLRVENLKVFI